jgi:hypothetical protein
MSAVREAFGMASAATESASHPDGTKVTFMVLTDNNWDLW